MARVARQRRSGKGYTTPGAEVNSARAAALRAEKRMLGKNAQQQSLYQFQLRESKRLGKFWADLRTDQKLAIYRQYASRDQPRANYMHALYRWLVATNRIERLTFDEFQNMYGRTVRRAA